MKYIPLILLLLGSMVLGAQLAIHETKQRYGIVDGVATCEQANRTCEARKDACIQVLYQRKAIYSNIMEEINGE